MIIGIDAKTLGKRKTGIGFYVQEIIKYLNEADDENNYILYSNRKIDLPFSLNANFKIKYYKAKIASFAIFYKLPKILRKDKVNLFWGPEHILPKKSKHYKMVVTMHDLAFAKIKGICTYNNIIIQGLFAKKSCRNADKIIAISTTTKHDIIDLYNITQDKIEVVYNGESPYKYSKDKVGTDKFKTLSEKFGINSEYLLFIGAIEPRKNIVNMVKAFEDYKSKTSSDIKFVIAGGLGWKTAPILDKIKMSKFNKEIIMTGYVSNEERENLYRNAKALMFVSLYEGLGLPIIEALSVGVPVITSNVSAMPEVGGNCCYYVQNPQDSLEISKILTEAIQDIDSKKIDKNILIEQSEKFSIIGCAKDTLEIFKKVVGI